MATTTRIDTASTLRLRESPLLRWVLEIDGIGSALNGLAYLVAAKPIADLLGLPVALLVPAGAFLVLYGAALIVMSTRPCIGAAAVRAVVAINLIWAADSLVVAFSGWFDPTGVGVGWILAQTALVVGFAVLQMVGLRRARR